MPVVERFIARPAAWWLALAALIALLLAPFLIVDVPPVLDYPNHLARLFVLARGSADPVLSAMYQPHWAILPNLGLDVAGTALVRVMPVHDAGRILLAVALLLPFLGAVAFSASLFGRTWWALATAIFAYSGFFFLGFMNFLCGVGLALFGAAAWVRFRQAPAPALVLGGAAAAVVLFFCHILGVFFFGVLIATHEAARLWRLRAAGRLGGGAVARSGILVAVVLVPAAILYQLSPLNDATGRTDWQSFSQKLVGLFTPVLTYDLVVGFGTGVVFLLLILAVWRRTRFDAGALIAAGICLVGFVAAPFAMKSGSFIDVRFMLMAVLALTAGMAPRLSFRGGVTVAAVVALLLFVRVGTVAYAWYGHRADLAELREVIAGVPPGARVLVVDASRGAPSAYRADEPMARSLPHLFRTDIHRAALLLIERRAFWPLLFADPRQQPLVVRPPYDAIAFPLGVPPTVDLLTRPLPRNVYNLFAPYLPDWCDTFDDVLVLNAGALADPALAPAWLEPVSASDAAALYRVRPPGGGRPACPV